MVDIGDQNGFGRKNLIANNLADNALGIDQCLANEYLLPAALVHDDLVAKRIHIHGHDFGNQHAVADLGRRFE